MPPIPPIGGLPYGGKFGNDDNSTTSVARCDGSDSHQDIVNLPRRQRHPQEYEDTNDDEGSSVHRIHELKRRGDSSSITSASTATSTATTTTTSSKTKRHTRSNRSKDRLGGSHSKESKDGDANSKDGINSNSNSKDKSHSSKHRKHRKKKDRSTSTSSTRSTSTTISLKSHLEANNNIKKVGGACGGNTSAGASVDENKTIKTSNINASVAASASAGGSNSNTASNDGAAGNNLGVNAGGNYHSNDNNNLCGKNAHHKSDRSVRGSSAAKKARAEAIAIAKAQMIADAKARLNANIAKNSKNKQDEQKTTPTTVQDYRVSKDYRVTDLSCIDEAETMNASDGKKTKQQQEQHSSDSITDKQKQNQFSYQPTNSKSNGKNTTSSTSRRSSPSRSPPGFFTKTRPHSTTPIPVIPTTRYSLSGSSRSSQSHSQSLASSHSQSLASSHSQSLSSHSQSLSSSHSQSITSSSHSQSVTSTHSYSQSGSMRFTFGETPLEAEEDATTSSLSSPLNLPEVSPISTSSAILASESYTTGTANYPKNLLRQSTNTIDSDNHSFSSLVSSPTSAFVAVPPRTPTPLSVSKNASNATTKTGEMTLSSFETNYHERQSASSNGFDRSEDDLQSLTSITSLTSLKSLASLNSGVSNSHSNFRSSHGDGNGNSNSHSLGHSSSTSILVSHEVPPQQVAEVADKIQMYMDFKQNRQRMESEAIIARLKTNPAGCEKSSSRDVDNDGGSAYTTPPPLAPPFPNYWDKREANNGTITNDTNESSRGANDDDDFFDTNDICNEYNNSSTSFIGTVNELPTAEQVQLRVKLRKERRRNSSSNSNKSGLSGLSGLSGSNRSGVSESVGSVTSPASGVSGISGNAVGGIVDLSVRKDVTKQQSHSLRSGIGGMSGVDYSSVRSDSEFSSHDQEGVESSDEPTSPGRQKKGSPYNEDSITSLSLDKRMGSGVETKLCSSLASVESSRDDGCGQSYRSSASSGDANLASSAQSNGSWRSFSSSHNNENVGSIGSGKVRKSKNLNDKSEGRPKQKEGFKKKRSSSISAAYEAAVVAKGGIFIDEAIGISKRSGSIGDKNQVKGRKRDENDLSNSLTEGSVVSSGSHNAPVSFLTTVSSRRTRDASINSHGGASVMSNVSGLSWGSLRIFNNKNSKGAKKVREERIDNGLTASGVSESSSQLVDDANKDDNGSVASNRSNESKSLQSNMSLKSSRSIKSAKSNRSINSSRSDRTVESSKKSKHLKSADKSKSGKSGGSVASAVSAGSSKKKKASECESPQEDDNDEDDGDSDDDQDDEGATIPNSILSNNNFIMRTSTTAALRPEQCYEQMGASVISPSDWINNDICSRMGIVGTSQGAPSVVNVAPTGVVAASYPSRFQPHAMSYKNAPSGILRGDGRYSPNDNFMETNRQHSSSRIKSILRGVQNRRDHSSDRNLDARSESSQKSKSSVLSSITATSTKLRGYLKSYRRRSSHSNEPQERPSQKRQGKSSQSEQSPGVLSQSKVPKYRPPINGPHHAMATNMQRYPSTCNYVGNPATSHDFHNINLLNEGSKHRVKFHDNCSIANGSAIRNFNDSASVVTTRSASSMNSLDRRVRQLNAPNSNGVTTKVFDLPWYDGRPNGIKGRYSGPVNAFLQPHGQGIIFVEGNSILQFHGQWKNGALISSLSSHGILSPSAGLDQKQSETDNSIQSGNKFDSASRDKMKAKETLFDASDESPQSSTCSVESNDGKSSKNCGRSPAKGGRQKSTLKYSLGDVARTPRDMVILRSNKEAIQSASMIKKFQQCFIKRSNGLWTVAILADRAMQPANQVQTRYDDSIHSFSSTGQQQDSSRWYTPDEINDSMDLEQSMLFVINSDGATKIIQKRHWGKYIRRLNDGSALSPGQESRNNEVREKDGKF